MAAIFLGASLPSDQSSLLTIAACGVLGGVLGGLLLGAVTGLVAMTGAWLFGADATSSTIGWWALVTAGAYADHHPFSRRDVASIVRTAGEHLRPVCTLKDAVKLAPLWPAQAPPLWYLSQRADVEVGGGAMQAVVEQLAARARSI